MKKTFTLFMMSLIVIISKGQSVLTQWFWTVADTATFTQASVGSGTLSFIGNVYGGSAAKWASGVKTGTYRLSTTNYPMTNDSSGSTGTVFSTSTVGNYGISVRYYFKNNSAASRYHRVKYTTDGTTWNTFKLNGSNAFIDNVTSGGNFQIDTVNNLLSDSGNSTKTYFGRFTLDLSSISGVDNNPNFKFFITPVFGPGDTAYVPANAAKTYLGGNSTNACLLSYDSVTVISQSIFPLPVTVSGFSASVFSAYAKISWHTANELNIANYELQKSTDALCFITINSSVANNKGLCNYSINDALPTGTSYYRLKINSLDGKSSYSNVISVSNKRSDNLLSIYPNPVLNSLTLIHTGAEDRAVIKISTADGKVITNYAVAKGATQTSIDVSHLQKGNYILLYENKGEAIATKFVK